MVTVDKKVDLPTEGKPAKQDALCLKEEIMNQYERQKRKKKERKKETRIAKREGKEKKFAVGFSRRTDDCHARVAVFRDVKAFAALLCALWVGGADQLGTQLGNARLQKTEVIRCRLVLLCASHFGLCKRGENEMLQFE